MMLQGIFSIHSLKAFSTAPILLGLGGAAGFRLHLALALERISVLFLCCFSVAIAFNHNKLEEPFILKYHKQIILPTA